MIYRFLVLAVLLAIFTCVSTVVVESNVDIDDHRPISIDAKVRIRNILKKIEKEVKRAGRSIEDELRRAGRAIEDEVRRAAKRLEKSLKKYVDNCEVDCGRNCELGNSVDCGFACQGSCVSDEVNGACRLQCKDLPRFDLCVAYCKEQAGKQIGGNLGKVVAGKTVRGRRASLGGSRPGRGRGRNQHISD